MLVDRAPLVTHLKHIHCGGKIPDAILSGRFAANAATTDRDLVVFAGGLLGGDPLPNELGVTNLELLIAVLESTDEDRVNMEVEDNKLVVVAHDRAFRLVTAKPAVIGTRIAPEHIAKVRQLVPESSDWHNLEHRFVEGVLRAMQIMKAEVMTLTVGPKGGVLGVGEAKLNIANFDLPDFRAPVEYELLLPKVTLQPVLKQLSDFTKAQMAVTGPDSPISIREGDYEYIVSPDDTEEKK